MVLLYGDIILELTLIILLWSIVVQYLLSFFDVLEYLETEVLKGREVPFNLCRGSVVEDVDDGEEDAEGGLEVWEAVCGGEGAGGEDCARPEVGGPGERRLAIDI